MTSVEVYDRCDRRRIADDAFVAADDCFDLLIVGGGINGVGIARDAAGRQLRVALIEQGDLAQATSSASTKLIHGGLRYLEFFEFRLVREALIERERLLGIAPHLIRPMEFILPHVEGLRPRWQIRLGLFFYDHIGTRQKLPASRSVRLATGRYGRLRAGLDHGFAYADCAVDDSRLVIANAIDAAERGARIWTRTRFVSAAPQGSLWHAQCQDVATGEKREIRARVLVNAAGPWVEQVLRSIPDVQAESQVRLVKGSHLVVPKLFEGEHAFMLQNPDGRIVFAIPYERDWTLIGTTDVPFTGDPSQVAISQEEIDYLTGTVRAYFERTIERHEIVWTYAGVRPLLDDESESASKVTRDYRLELAESPSHPPVLSIFGGKITTYRRLAEAALGKLTPFVRGSRGDWTDTAPLPGGDLLGADFDAFLSEVRRHWPFLSPVQASRLAHAYGTRVERVLGSATTAADLGEEFGGGLTRSEVEYLLEQEWARTPEDVLWRRTKAGLHMSAQQRELFARTFQELSDKPRTHADYAAS
jgi:glycerol-3-phosphate dehydrogenase